MIEVFFATMNKDKIIKMQNRLKDLDIKIITPYDININIEIEENGKNVIENATLKTKAYFDKVKIPTIATDSSLYVEKFDIQPTINNELYELIHNIEIPKIIISTTTDLFINYELKSNVKDFAKVYSCVDYFKIGGKTKNVYLDVCKELNVKSNEVLHIGDSKTMDFENAKKAGVNAILYENDINKLKSELKKYLEV